MLRLARALTKPARRCAYVAGVGRRYASTSADPPPAEVMDLLWADQDRFWFDAMPHPHKADRVYELHWSLFPRVTAAYLSRTFNIADDDVSEGGAIAYKALFDHYRMPGLQGDDRELRNMLTDQLVAHVELALADRQLLDVHAETRGVHVVELRRRAIVEADLAHGSDEPGSSMPVAFVDGEGNYLHIHCRLGREDVDTVERLYRDGGPPPLYQIMGIYSKIMKRPGLRVRFEFDLMVSALERFGLYRRGTTDLLAGSERFRPERRILRLVTQPLAPPGEEGAGEESVVPRFRIAGVREAGDLELDEADERLEDVEEDEEEEEGEGDEEEKKGRPKGPRS
eukprot:tig00000711_g3367.t1